MCWLGAQIHILMAGNANNRGSVEIRGFLHHLHSRMIESIKEMQEEVTDRSPGHWALLVLLCKVAWYAASQLMLGTSFSFASGSDPVLQIQYREDRGEANICISAVESISLIL